MSANIITKASEFIAEKKLLKTTDNILCAVSGGKDSVAMCLLLKNLGYNIALAHVNFNLRGKESDLDEAFVKDLSAQLNCRFHIVRLNTTELLQQGESIQMAARRLRYNWFEELVSKHKYSKLATAHSANDNVETIIYNISKGTGVKGLVGIPAKNGNIIRPILGLTTDEILEFLKSKNQSFRSDKSNDTDKYARNKIRHHVLPILKEINPSLIDTITEHSKRLERINAYYQTSIKQHKEKFWRAQNGYLKLNLDELNSLNKNSTKGKNDWASTNFLLECFLPLGFSKTAVFDIISAKTGAEVKTEKCRLIKNRSELLLVENKTLNALNHTINNLESGELELEFGTLSWKLTNTIKTEELRDSKTAFIDVLKLEGPIVLKSAEKDTYFKPFGMKGSQLLSDYMINNKWNVLDKEAAMVIENKNEIVWLVGHRTSENFKIDDNTKTALKFTWVKKPNLSYPFILNT